MYTVINNRVRANVYLSGMQEELWLTSDAFRKSFKESLIDRHAAADEITIRSAPGGQVLAWIQLAEEPTLRMKPEEINPLRATMKGLPKLKPGFWARLRRFVCLAP